ncbi:expressed unknown protein [Seminavis robusta]|uniref:SCP domain-containing protein n=1 Tax=Seminavis robusta TaxID=568900 RepID=A0A9N8H4J5_9STRA|nr:expressed unknown protein [Seminavis robusta]|eukprot:Sro116_g057060.1 n/a (235) ;mRNA; r:56054-56758
MVRIRLSKIFMKKSKAQKSKGKQERISVDGKYFTAIPRWETDLTETSMEEDTMDDSWNSSDCRGHHRHAPLVAKEVLMAQRAKGVPVKIAPETREDEQRNLNITMARAKELPKTSFFTSNHVMVNRIRAKRNVPPLRRSPELDEVARWHAQQMAAKEESAFHPDPADVVARLGKPSRRIGSNVTKGQSTQHMHGKMLEKRGDYNNMIDRRYISFGMGTAKGPDGELYMCQIYRG